MRDQEAMGHAIDFVNWATHMVDHMAKVHPHWRHALEWMAVTKQDVSLSKLATETAGPFQDNSRELAVKLEQTLVDWLPEQMYTNRAQLCGGR